MLPFNAFWDASRLDPDGEIDLSYSDDMGRNWVKGNGGRPLEPANLASARQAGHVEDKQWVAVNHIPGNKFQDHVYAAWSVFNSSATKVRMAVSRDRGAIYVARSTDAQTFSPFVQVTSVGLLPTGQLPNTTFRDGITENFAASPTYPGHLYLTYEDWNGTQMDVKFTQSTNGGSTRSEPVVVNDSANSATTDQFQRSVAAGPGGAVAVAFYDRRTACPNDASVLPQDLGRTNFLHRHLAAGV
jgi:hypothetical protein